MGELKETMKETICNPDGGSIHEQDATKGGAKEAGRSSTVPDGGCQAWTVVFASFLMSFIQDGFSYSFGLLLLPLVNIFNVGRTEASFTSSVHTFLTIGSGPVAVLLIKKTNHRICSIIGTMIAILGLLISGLYIQFAPQEHLNIVVIYFSLGGMTGLGLGLIFFTAIDVLNFFFDKKLGTANGIACAGSGLGQMAIAPLITWTLTDYGIAGSLFTMTGLVGACIVFAFFYKTPEQAEMNEPCSKNKEDKATMWAALKDFQFLLILTSQFLWWLAVFCALSFTADRAVQRGITDLAGSTVLLSIMGITNCIGRLVWGPIIDKYKSKILLFSFSTMSILAASVIVSEFLTTFAGQAVYAGLVGLSMGAQVTSSVVILQVVFGRVTERLGIYVLNIGASGVIANFLVGQTFDTTGSYSHGFLAAGSLAFLGACLPLLIQIFWTPVNKLKEKKSSDMAMCDNTGFEP